MGIAEQPFDVRVLGECRFAASAHRRGGNGDGGVAGRGLCFEHAQHGRLARTLEVADHVVDAGRKAVGLDLHRRKLRAQRRQAFAEGLAEMLEARSLEMGRGRRGRCPAEAQRHCGRP
jgi:hypothetical protein